MLDDVLDAVGAPLPRDLEPDAPRVGESRDDAHRRLAHAQHARVQVLEGSVPFGAAKSVLDVVALAYRLREDAREDALWGRPAVHWCLAGSAHPALDALVVAQLVGAARHELAVVTAVHILDELRLAGEALLARARDLPLDEIAAAVGVVDFREPAVGGAHVAERRNVVQPQPE